MYKQSDWLSNSPGGDDSHTRVRGDEVRLLVANAAQALEGGLLHAGDAGADVPGVGGGGQVLTLGLRQWGSGADLHEATRLQNITLDHVLVLGCTRQSILS